MTRRRMEQVDTKGPHAHCGILHISARQYTRLRDSPYDMYGLLPHCMSSQSCSVVARPKSVNLTITFRLLCTAESPRLPSAGPNALASFSATVSRSILSQQIKFSGLISRWLMPASWQTATASHICENMEAMSRRRSDRSRVLAEKADKRDGVGGVCDS